MYLRDLNLRRFTIPLAARSVISCILLSFLSAFMPFTAICQNTSSIQARLTDLPVIIDGSLDEAAWQKAEPVSGFFQIEPNEGQPSSRKTEVRVLFGQDDLYIGAVMYDNPGDIENNLGRRDEYNRADWFMVSIDSYFHKKTAYTFAVNAAGVQLDGMQDDNQRLSIRGRNPMLPAGLDVSWNAIWFSAVRITDEGWTAEFRIPYSMLRFPESESQTWGIHFTRRIPRLGELSEWPHIPRTERSNMVARYGQIRYIENIKPARNIQIRPYALSGLNVSENMLEPGRAYSTSRYDIGSDFKMGLGSNVMLDATFNPDFGQVEADPAVLNLTAFETFFAEQRPFFLEGADIFQFGIGNSRLFYTRRFGANEPIIGAAKLSGRSANGLSFGVMGTTSGSNFNPSHNYGVLRMSQQVSQYSSAGGILTAYQSPAKDGIGWKSMTGGVDWDMRFNDNRYSFEGITAFSNRQSLLPGRDDEKGFMSGLVLRKREGAIDGHFTLLLFSDRYNPNDIGWISFEQNWYQIWSNVTYKIRSGQPFGAFQRGNINLHYTRRYSYLEWYDMGSSQNLRTDLMTRNFRLIRVGTRFTDMFGGYDIWETRGLGIWAKPYNIQVTGEYNTDERRNWKITPQADYRMVGDGGSTYSTSLESIVNVGTRLSFLSRLKGEWEKSFTAWSSNESFMQTDGEWRIGIFSKSPDQLTTDDYTGFTGSEPLHDILAGVSQFAPGQYYVPVFGARDTRSLDLTLRSSLTFTSTFSVQLYTQLFLARGEYNDFSILVNPDQLVGFDTYPKRRDLNYSNLQSNLVMRWEYRPSSTIYLVWSHGRRKNDVMNPLAPLGEVQYERPINKQVGDLFNIFPNNSFMLKIDYAFY